MAIYPVKYNPFLTYIPGATQVGNLAVAIGDVDYSTGGWIAGVSDANGYVIYSDTISLNLVGRTTGGGTGTASSNMPTFYRSQFKTDSSLLQLINRIPGNTQSFNDINSAKAWLSATPHTNILGGTYSGGGATGSGWQFYYTEGPLAGINPPLNNGEVIFVINIPASSATYDPNYYIGSGGQRQILFNENQSDGSSYLSAFNTLVSLGGTVSISQEANTVIYSGAGGGAGIFFIQTQGLTNMFTINTQAATLVQPASSPFISGTPITLTIS